MHVDQVLRARPLVQVVDVLGHEQNAARPFGLQPRQGQMRRVGRDTVGNGPLAPGIVEAEHPFRVAGIGFGRGHVLDPVARPDAVRIAEGREPRFLGNARPRQNDDGRPVFRRCVSGHGCCASPPRVNYAPGITAAL